MRALIYLMFTQMKNRILSLRKKPGMLILYGFILLMVIGSVLLLIFTGEYNTKEVYADSRILYLFLCGFGLLYYFTFTTSGLATGSSFFTMADVGLLFVAPISNKKILFYGLISTIGKTVIASIFIIYQISNLRNNFGYGMTEVLALFLIYIIMIIFCQTYSIGIYVFSNGNQARKNIVKAFLFLSFGILILSVYMIILNKQVDILEAIKILVDSKWFGYFPIAGWSVMLFKGILAGSTMQIVISLALFVGISALVVTLLTAHDADYYEDVLYSTEIMHQRLKDYKEGRNVSSTTYRKVKIKDNENGFMKSKGAFVFAYKHLLEMKRGSRLIFVDIVTILIAIGAGIAGYYMKDDKSAYIFLGTIIYFQYFVTVFGRLKIELIKPYIYLVPETSFKKLFAASISSLLKPCIDSVIIFGVFALVGGAGIMQCIFMALAYCSSGAVFVGLTVLYQRIFGGQPNRVIKTFLGVLLMFIIFTPSIIATILIAIFIIPETLQFLYTLPFTGINLMCAFIIFYGCRNMLDNTEYSEGMM